MGSAIPLSVFLGSVIRSFLVLTKIRFTSGNASGFKISFADRWFQRIQEPGSQIPVACRSFYAYNEHIREVGINSLYFSVHFVYPPKSGNKVTFLPFNIWHFSREISFRFSAANQIKIGKTALAIKADFSLSTIATVLSG